MSPMCQYSSVDGFASDWHLVHLGSRAVGGASLVIQEATAVSLEGRISPGDMGIWKDEHIAYLARIVSFMHQQGALAGIQLAHAGRKASVTEPWNGGRQIHPDKGGWQTIAPSAIGFNNDDYPPVAMGVDEIQRVIADFAAATQRSVQAGYDVIEIHAAHGYLIHEFLSPLSNLRTDDYGGSFENRVRLLLEIADTVKAQLNGQLLFVRISATDWVEDGWDIRQSVQLAGLLQQKGVNLIDTSTGGNVAQARIPMAAGYQVKFAAQIKRETGILTGAVGLINDAQQAERILENGDADLIFMAREFLRDPYFPLHAAMQLDGDALYPVQYGRAKSQKP